MSTIRPTAEQQAIIDAAPTGEHLTIEAGAGSGKTSTLKLVAAAMPNRRGVYLAYNKAIATDAEKSFPNNVTCKTAHSFAYGAVGRDYRDRLNAGRIPAYRAAQILGIREAVKVDDQTITEKHLARLVSETVQRFCYSNDREITPRHVPFVNGVERAGQRELARYLAPIAQRAWDTDLTQKDGKLRFTHDMYLKMWILTDPQFNADYVLLDEAQDSNPAVAGLVARQRGQQILVGDRCQAIYGWRGATDAMEHFDGQRFYLSQSFRFGSAVAAEANKWLTLLDSPLRLTGFDQIPSRVEDLDTPDAILCRSNGGAIGRVISAMKAGRRAALVGGGNDIRRMAEAAQSLQQGRPTGHPELFAFGSWAEVQEYVASGEGKDLEVMVKLVDRHGADELIRVCDRLTDERYADVVVSTAHKAKGREWNRVQIATDFPEPKSTDEDKAPKVAREDAMLAYVAVTRAQLVLDREGLAWVDDYLAPVVPVVAPAPAAAPVAERVEVPADGLSPECRRCGQHHTECTCRLMPDRRPLVAAGVR